MTHSIEIRANKHDKLLQRKKMGESSDQKQIINQKLQELEDCFKVFGKPLEIFVQCDKCGIKVGANTEESNTHLVNKKTPIY